MLLVYVHFVRLPISSVGVGKFAHRFFGKQFWRLSRSGDVRGEVREQPWRIPMAWAQTRLTLPRCRVSIRWDPDAAVEIILLHIRRQ